MVARVASVECLGALHLARRGWRGGRAGHNWRCLPVRLQGVGSFRLVVLVGRWVVGRACCFGWMVGRASVISLVWLGSFLASWEGGVTSDEKVESSIHRKKIFSLCCEGEDYREFFCPPWERFEAQRRVGRSVPFGWWAVFLRLVVVGCGSRLLSRLAVVGWVSQGRSVPLWEGFLFWLFLVFVGFSFVFSVSVGGFLGRLGHEGLATKAGQRRLANEGLPTKAGQRRLASEGWPTKAGQRRLANEGLATKAWPRRLANEGWPMKACQRRLANEGWPTKAGQRRLASEGWPTKAGQRRPRRLANEGWPTKAGQRRLANAGFA